MSLFNSVTLTVTRPAAGAWVKGKWVQTEGEPFPVTGSLQPTTGDKIKTLIEGRRVTGVYKFITSTPLKAGSVDEETNSDIVTIDGEPWMVMSVGAYQNGILPHYECYLIREKEGA